MAMLQEFKAAPAVVSSVGVPKSEAVPEVAQSQALPAVLPEQEKKEELGTQTLKEITHLKKEILGLSTVLKVYLYPDG